MTRAPVGALGTCRPARPRHPGAGMLVLLLALAGCGHSEPFPPGAVDDAGPLTPGSPVRLTLNAGADRYPAWLRDGSGLLYSYQDVRLPDRDRCLGLLPPGGGTRQLGRCMPGDYSHDDTNALLTSAASPGGQIAWFEAEGLRTLGGPERGELRVGPTGATARGRAVQAFPYFAPGGRLHAMAATPAWLGDTALLYVGAEVLNIVDCPLCVTDSVVTGREIVLLHLGGATPALEILPSTLEATSLSVARDGSALFYTRAGDARIFRRDLATGAVTTAHDFGATGIVRDVSVADSTLVAIVGGSASYYTDPQYGPIQRDQGGDLYHLNLNSGIATQLGTGGQRFRMPALAPDGRHVAVELHSDLAGISPDLYLYETP